MGNESFSFGPAKITMRGKVFCVLNLRIDWGRGVPLWPFVEDAYVPVYRGRFVDDEMLAEIAEHMGGGE